MQGPWELVFQSDINPGLPTVLEMNLTQSGTHLTAGATSTLAFEGQGTGTWAIAINLSRFGGECNNSGTDEIVFDGTLADQTSASQPMTFTLTETSASGSAAITGTATATMGGSIAIDGTYSLPAACGFPEDHGIVQGFKDSAKFSSGQSFSGNFAGHAMVVNFAYDSSGFGMTASGTDNGAPFTLTGTTVGMSFTATGTISNQTNYLVRTLRLDLQHF